MEIVDTVTLNFSESSLNVLNIILGIVMFGVALDMRLEDFQSVRKKPQSFFIGLFCQFLLLPALTFLLLIIWKPIPSMALGAILVASCPGGNMSNFFTHFAKGNTALSVSMSAVSTLASTFLTPINFMFWGSLYLSQEGSIEAFSIPFWNMFYLVSVLLGLPMILGLFIAHKFPAIAEKAKKPMKIFSLIFFTIFVAAAIASNAEFFMRFLGLVGFLVIIHNALALGSGYGMARLFKLNKKDRKAVTIEVGIQNSGLGLILIFNFFNGLGGMAVVAAAWGVWHLISGLGLGFFWSKQEKNEDLSI